MRRILTVALVLTLGSAACSDGASSLTPAPASAAPTATTAAVVTPNASSGTTTAPTATAKATITPTAKPTAVPPVTFGDGSYIVGTDIQPGTYRTTAASSGCYWERLSGLGGTVGEILANDNTSGPAVVTIAKTDKGFDATNCGTWTSDLSAITTSRTAFDEGTYIVGVDFTAGLYRTTTASSGCYWARLRNFLGAVDSIIANDNTDARATVQIAKTDKGFVSTRCASWVRIG